MLYKNTWNEFNMTTVGDYHDHYLKINVLLLVDAFERFIDACLKLYERIKFSSFPGLCWNAMLRMTGVKLEKNTDTDMHLFLEQGLRG